MLQLKGCPRCQGDLVLDKDHFGWYQSCIQCGMNIDLPEMTVNSTNVAKIPRLGS